MAEKKTAAKKPPVKQVPVEEEIKSTDVEVDLASKETPAVDDLNTAALEGVLDDGLDDELDEEGNHKEPAGEKEEPLKPEDASAVGAFLIVKAMNATATVVPELSDFFTDDMVNGGAPRVGAVLVKHQGKAPEGLAKFFADWEEEIMCGFWFGGVVVGGVLHYKRKVREEEKNADEPAE